MGRLDGRIGAGERDHTLGYIRSEWWNTRGSCFIAQEAVVTSLHEAFLPAPHAGLRLSSPPHDLMGADAVRAQQNNLGAPDMLMRRVGSRASAARRRRSLGLRVMEIPVRMRQTRTRQVRRESLFGFKC